MSVAGQQAPPAEVSETPADDLRRAIARTARRMRREAGGPLTPTQLATLASVWRLGEATPGTLAELEGVRRPTMTRVIAQLEEAGMVERRADPRDGRCFLITPTEEGRACLDDQRTRKSAWLARMLDRLDPEDVHTLQRAAAILEHALEEERD